MLRNVLNEWLGRGKGNVVLGLCGGELGSEECAGHTCVSAMYLCVSDVETVEVEEESTIGA